MRELPVTRMPEPEAASHDDRQQDLVEWLDLELSRQPDRYRIPIILCELEGKTHREAAEQLGWPIGTVSGRLSRARTMLAIRLSRRGMSLSAGSLAVLLAQESAKASMPAGLIGSTARAASLFAAGGAKIVGTLPIQVSTLTRGVQKAMWLSRIRSVGIVLITLAIASTGLAWTASRGSAVDQEPGRTRSVKRKPDLSANFRATVDQMIKDPGVVVTRISIESLPGATVQVVADRPGTGGGLVVASGDAGKPAHTQLTILADHVDAGPTGTLKFLMTLRARGASSTTSSTGPMPEGKRLADQFKLAIQPGVFRYGKAAKLVKFGDGTYSLVVKKPR